MFNTILKNDRISEEWRRSVLILSFRNKRAVVTAQSHTAKIQKRVLEENKY